jgi:hypothetical protein
MYDHTAERVADLLHAERLAQVAQQRRIAEAEAATTWHRTQAVGERYRAAVARLLIALAKRITPVVPSNATTQTAPTPG